MQNTLILAQECAQLVRDATMTNGWLMPLPMQHDMFFLIETLTMAPAYLGVLLEDVAIVAAGDDGHLVSLIFGKAIYGSNSVSDWDEGASPCVLGGGLL